MIHIQGNIIHRITAAVLRDWVRKQVRGISSDEIGHFLYSVKNNNRLDELKTSWRSSLTSSKFNWSRILMFISFSLYVIENEPYFITHSLKIVSWRLEQMYCAELDCLHYWTTSYQRLQPQNLSINCFKILTNSSLCLRKYAVNISRIVDSALPIWFRILSNIGWVSVVVTEVVVVQMARYCHGRHFRWRFRTEHRHRAHT